MLGEIIKHFFSNEYGPVDRLLELCVLLLIAYEVGIGIKRHRQEKRERKRLNGIVTALTSLMQDGQAIQVSLGRQVEQQGAWAITVTKWSDRVGAYLSTLSPSAVAAFSLVVAPVAQNMRLYREPNGSAFQIGGLTLEAYESLLAKLDNLRTITKNPEAYF
jgi:hypothetical protein